MQSVKNFFREVQDSPLEEVYLCDMKEETVAAFIDGLCREFGEKNVTKMQPETRPRKPACKVYFYSTINM